MSVKNLLESHLHIGTDRKPDNCSDSLLTVVSTVWWFYSWIIDDYLRGTNNNLLFSERQNESKLNHWLQSYFIELSKISSPLLERFGRGRIFLVSSKFGWSLHEKCPTQAFSGPNGVTAFLFLLRNIVSDASGQRFEVSTQTVYETWHR